MLLTVLTALALAFGEPRLVVEEPEVIADGRSFTEGPVWLPSNELLYTDVTANAIFRGDGSVFREPSNAANGLALGAQGRLYICEQDARRVVRLEDDGGVTVIADAFENRPLNRPNDLVVASDGTVYFTDPKPRDQDGPNDLEYSGVFAVTTDGAIHLISEDFKYPNGIGLSPDGKTLYVADTMGAQITAYDITAPGKVGAPRKFAGVRIPDGMAIDRHGNVWSTSAGGILVWNAEGDKLAEFRLPRMPTNCTFGGENGEYLIVTARPAVYRVNFHFEE